MAIVINASQMILFVCVYLHMCCFIACFHVSKNADTNVKYVSKLSFPMWLSTGKVRHGIGKQMNWASLDLLRKFTIGYG